MVWIQFAVCIAIIAVAGTRLSKYGDIIADRTGLGHVWVGMVLLATATSLPEIATGLGAVAIMQVPDLAIGDLFGASLVNLAIIALVDALYTKGPVLQLLGTGVVLATILSMLLIAAAATSILLAQSGMGVEIIGLVGIYSLMLFCLYLMAQYMLFRFQTRQAAAAGGTGAPTPAGGPESSLRKTLLYFGLSSAAIVGAGIWLGFIGDQISTSTGLKASFVGTFFLALSTTAPEMAVSISAARIGALEMAVANVVGSNLFNMGVIIFLNDLFFRGDEILKNVSSGHVVTALFALMMSSIVIIGIIFRPRRWMRLWVGTDTAFIAALYVAALATLYFIGG